MEQYRFIIFGKVQGVYYRKFVSQNAMKRSVRGYVKNLPDGTVEVVAELIDDELEEFLDILKDGSPLCKVEEIRHEIDDEADLIYDGFEIRY
jgi:acylphosphatase